MEALIIVPLQMLGMMLIILAMLFVINLIGKM